MKLNIFLITLNAFAIGRLLTIAELTKTNYANVSFWIFVCVVVIVLNYREIVKNGRS